MPSPALAAALGLAALLAAALPARAELELLMFNRAGCEWCAKWEEEIGGGYASSAEGRQAPVRRVPIHEGAPEGVALDRPPRYTPTFVLLADGEEVGRIDGYPGASFFYPMLARLIERADHRAD